MRRIKTAEIINIVIVIKFVILLCSQDTKNTFKLR